jgi:glyoxylate reductase
VNVVVSQPMHDDELARLRAAGLEVIGPLSDEPARPEQLVAALRGAEILLAQLTDVVNADVIGDGGLRLVANIAVGYDNIDLAAAVRHGVMVTNTPDVLTAATADFTLALLLAVARRLPEADALIRSGGFDGWRLLQEPMGTDVSGAVLGIVGMGRIGRAVARRAALGFDMEILYAGGKHSPETAGIAAREVSLDVLLASSDFVSLHLPLRPETRHLIDAQRLVGMRRTAYLINTARGALVDEAALVEALRQGVIAGAALDVFEREPSLAPGLVECRERVVLAPHLGSATDSTRRRMSAMAVDNVLAFASGHVPPNLVGAAAS